MEIRPKRISTQYFFYESFFQDMVNGQRLVLDFYTTMTLHKLLNAAAAIGFYRLIVIWRIDNHSKWQWCHLEKWRSFLMTDHLLVTSSDVISISKNYY